MSTKRIIGKKGLLTLLLSAGLLTLLFSVTGAYAVSYNLYFQPAPAGATDGCSLPVGTDLEFRQTFQAASTFKAYIATAVYGSTGDSGGHLYANLTYTANNTELAVSSLVVYNNNGQPHNFTFTTQPVLIQDENYTLSFWRSSGDNTAFVKCLVMDTTNPYDLGYFQRGEDDWGLPGPSLFDGNVELWGLEVDSIGPLVSLSCSATQANITATDNVGLEELRFLSNSTGTWQVNATNSTPYNGSVWSIPLNLAGGTWLLGAEADDLTDNKGYAANCTVDVAITTTTAPATTTTAGNGTIPTSVTVNVPGLGWLILIALAAFLVWAFSLIF